jgi:type II secretory pathway component PulF
MAVFEYVAVAGNEEGHQERGTVVARDKLEAYDKLRRLGFTDIKLKRLEGWNALLSKWTATVK